MKNLLSLTERCNRSLLSSSGIRHWSFVIRNWIGFTLVELMIVIAIIGVLAASLFPMMSGYMDRARDAATQANVRKLSTHLSMYINDVGGFSWANSDQWYCIPLWDTAGCTHPVLPWIEALPIRVKDFSIQTEGYPFPLLGINGSGTGTFVSTSSGIINTQSPPYYILEWTLPWNSGYSGSAIYQPTDIEKANKRCLPGKVRWINHIPDQTACHMLIQ